MHACMHAHHWPEPPAASAAAAIHSHAALRYIVLLSPLQYMLHLHFVTLYCFHRCSTCCTYTSLHCTAFTAAVHAALTIPCIVLLSPLQYDEANRRRRAEEARDERWLAQLARPTRISYRWGPPSSWLSAGLLWQLPACAGVAATACG